MIGRRDSILDAALSCFSQRGYDATTIEEIRARSGASVGSIYHHFGGKDRIAAALYEEALRDYQAGFLEALGGNGERTIKGIVRHHLRWVEADPERSRFLLAERRPSSEAALRELNRTAFDALAAWRDAHSHELQPVSFDGFYAVVVGPAQEAARHWLAGRTRTPLRRLERELADAAWRAIRGGST
jgi:AcrR family transcriptional regulator